MTAGLVIICGEPGAGKTSMLFAALRAHAARGWRTIAISNIDERALPLGVDEAMTVERALELAGDEPVCIGIDEVNTEVDDVSRRPSPPLLAIARFRRHMRVMFLAATQRPRDMPPRVRDLDTQWRFMRWTDTSAHDFQWLERHFPEQARQLPRLEPYWWEPGAPDPVEGVHYLRR